MKPMKIISLLLTLTVSGLAAAQETITLWRHASADAETEVFQQTVTDFNNSQSEYKIEVQNLPQGDYTTAVTSAALASNLPCIVDVDQPDLANYAWAGYLQPLGLPSSLTDQLIPTALGIYKGEIYTASQTDAVLVFYGLRSAFEASGVPIPTVDNPWNTEEFEAALQAFSELPDYQFAVDLRNFDTGPDWWAYGYSPMLQSFGGDLIDRQTYETANGVLNSPEAVAFGEWFQGLFEKGYAENNPAGPTFYDGLVPLAYDGSWAASAAREAAGDDLLILPPPDLGNGPKVGSGSWAFGINADCENAEGARTFIEYLLTPENIAAAAGVGGLIPTSEAAAQRLDAFKPEGQDRVFFDIASAYAFPRPATPAWPTIKTNFQQAMQNIVNGADVASSLDDAAFTIDQNIADNNGYQ